MGVKQDYIMRMIENMVRMIVQLLLGKGTLDYQLPDKKEAYTDKDYLFERLIQMADDGMINEAENLLFEELDNTDLEYLEMALCFYMHLNDEEADFLEEHNYSKEEIKDGISMLGKEYGISGLV